MFRKISIGLTILAQAVLLGGLPIAARAESKPIISAVQTTGGTGQTNNDFIELYNPNDQAFNLNGYRLVKRSATSSVDSSIKSWTTDTLIPAHSFYLWANSAYTTIGVVPDLTSTATLSDNNGVALRQGAADIGTIIDSFSWGTATNGFPIASATNPSANESLARKDLFDSSLGYEIHASNPRNSTVQVLPPDGPPPPADNAACSSTVQNIDATTSQTVPVTVSFANNGTTTWDLSYKLSDNFSNHYSLPDSVAPNAAISFDLNLVAPATAGQVSYQFQMQNQTTTFGETCSLILNVTAPPVVPPPPTPTTIRINELLPNPTGDDSGLEQIELYNYGTENIDLSGWVMDDVAATDPLSTNAYTLNSGSIAPQGYAVVTLPPGSFALNNTGGDLVTLFSVDGTAINTAIYETAAPENQSYSYFEDGWQWTGPTFGSANIKPVVEPPATDPPPVTPPLPDQVPTVSINEVYSFPLPQETEFLELYNFGGSSVNLQDLTLQVGDKRKSLPDVSLAPGDYFVVNDKNLPAALRNTGQSILLISSGGNVVDSLDYPKSDRGQSYSKFEDGFLWTLVATPGAQNQLVVPEDKKAKAATTIANSKPPTQTKTTVTKPKTTTSSTAVPAALAASGPENDTTTKSSVNVNSAKKNRSVVILLIAGAGTVSLGMWLAYRYGFKEQPDFA